MRLATLALGFLLGAIVFIGASLVLAWTGPTSAPPNGNVAAPLNVGTTDQIKNAGLGVNSLAVFGNAILSGTSRYLNFGSTAGSAGYGIRDNAGTIEFKNSGGSWQGMLSASSTFSQITFADGTTQTTAGGGIGTGQTWQDVTASRTFGTTYTNSTGKPIFVSVWNVVSNTSMSLIVDGIEVGRLQNAVQWGWDSGQLTTIVPNGSTYSVTGTRHPTLFKWAELR